MMEAAWEGKLIATSKNDITAEYISDEHGIADNNVENVAKQIQDLYPRPEECKKKVNNLQDFLSTHCSSETYSKTIAKLITNKQNG